MGGDADSDGGARTSKAVECRRRWLRGATRFRGSVRACPGVVRVAWLLARPCDGPPPWSTAVESSFELGIGRSLIDEGVSVEGLLLVDKRRRKSVTGDSRSCHGVPAWAVHDLWRRRRWLALSYVSVLRLRAGSRARRPTSVSGTRGCENGPDDVYHMRMARVNITVPDDVVAAARAAGLNVSRLATAALTDELDRLAKIDALDAYLAELEAELGPPTPEEIGEAARWAERFDAGSTRPRRQRTA